MNKIVKYFVIVTVVIVFVYAFLVLVGKYQDQQEINQVEENIKFFKEQCKKGSKEHCEIVERDNL